MKIIKNITIAFVLLIVRNTSASAPASKSLLGTGQVIRMSAIINAINDHDKYLHQANMEISPHEREQLVQQQMCRTISGPCKASDRYRHLFYTALKECGHQTPELIIVRADSSLEMATLGASCTHIFDKGKFGMHIKYDPLFLDKLGYGQQRVCARHEAMHLIRKLFSANSVIGYSLSNARDEERQADAGALIVANCSKCCMATCHYHLDSNTIHRGVTLKNLQSLNRNLLVSLERALRIESEKTDGLHPLFAERAVTAYIAALDQRGKLCQFHEKKTQQLAQQQLQHNLWVQSPWIIAHNRVCRAIEDITREVNKVC